MSNIQDIKHNGIDVEEKLMKILSEQLAKEIDKEVIKMIRGMCITRKQKIKKILNKV